MQKLFTFILMVFLTMAFTVNEAAAKRFGGGRFYGGHRTSGFSSPFAKKTNRGVISQTAPNKSRGFFRGMLIGGLLASLFMGHGIGGAMISWILVIGLVVFMLNILRRRRDDVSQ